MLKDSKTIKTLLCMYTIIFFQSRGETVRLKTQDHQDTPLYSHVHMHTFVFNVLLVHDIYVGNQ